MIDCSIVSPAPSKRHAHVLQFPVGRCKGTAKWNVRRFLDMLYNRQLSLADIGIVEAPGQQGVSATLAAWMMMASATLSSSDPDPLQAL
eukprot:2322353-Rhodomonas_salina.1